MRLRGVCSVLCNNRPPQRRSTVFKTSDARLTPLILHRGSAFSQREPSEPIAGTKTPAPVDQETSTISKSAFYFEAGYALFAKRPSRPFPPSFLSLPSGSFSDPLTTHNRSKDKRLSYRGQLVRGITNGDDAVLVSENLIVTNDGVGAWAQKEKGHAALWSRLLLHFWALEAERNGYGGSSNPDPLSYLQEAFEQTQKATSSPNQWLGTTTTSGALMHSDDSTPPKPLLFVTQLGDSQILVIRPRDETVVFKTEEQWHWFDCPRQLGTNSPDTPKKDAVVDVVEIQEDDVILAMTDGVTDNLWEHEVVRNVIDSIRTAEKEYGTNQYAEGMQYVATELVKSARKIAEDPFAESPYMERAVEEGLPTEGGKLDDISVVAAICRRRRAS